MRSIRSFLAAALMLAAAACTTTAGDIASVYAQVQAATQTACAFLPTVTTVAALVSDKTANAAAIAAEICAVVTNVGSGPRSTRGTTSDRVVGHIDGVPIEGRFVR